MIILKVEILSDCVKCSLDTGQFFLVDIDDKQLIYKHKWRINSLGYVFYGRSGLLHRLIMNPPKKKVVDHINGKPWDCRKSNMRIITQKQNSYNSTISKNNKSGYKGVSFSNQRKKYESCICVDGRTIHLGRYKDLKEAALAYNKAASFYFGEYARLNDMGGI